jgi:hypothetical protein
MAAPMPSEEALCNPRFSIKPSEPDAARQQNP